MVNFRIGRPENSSVYSLYLDQEEIWLDPPYQRLGGIWNVEKKQLLIDSLLNDFDIPKLYFHDFYPAESHAGRDFRYAIIDGKQRLNAIWSFIDGEFPLANDIELLNSPEVDVRGLTYAELGEQHPRLKAAFDARNLPVVAVMTQDTELIEEMFSRLNEAVPLNAAEKRNAFGGPIPEMIRKISAHKFLKDAVPFPNSRYRHYDLICKFLLLQDEVTVTDLKKEYLDGFVKEFRDRTKKEAQELRSEVEETFETMRGVFVSNDDLLSRIAMFILFYLLYAELTPVSWSSQVPRKLLVEFEATRQENRKIAADDVAKASYDLLEFDRFSQSPNDKFALEFRLKVLLEWLEPRMT